MSHDHAGHGWTPIAEEAARATRMKHPDKHMPKPLRRRVLTVANQKGGVGKTTSTVNLAAALALHGLKVLVIDLDPQGNASTALGVEHRSGTPSVYEVLLGEMTLSDAAAVSDQSDNLYCVPATIDLAGSEIELVSMSARESRLKEALSDEALDQLQPDYVFIDCPPSLGLLTVNAMVAAQEVLIPIQCEYYALEGLSQLLSNIKLVQTHLNPTLDISTILLTMYDGRTKLADQVTAEVRKHFERTVLKTVIPRSVKVSEAPGYGQTVLAYDPGSRGAMSYLDAAKEIADRGAGLEALVSERKGGLGRGLASLIPQGPPVTPASQRPTNGTTTTGTAPEPVVESEVAGAVYREIPTSSIKANPKQPRQVFDEDALAELEHSIREFGLMQPIVVRELGAGEYELVMGERRLRASQRAELAAIPAIVRQTADDAMLRDALLENIHRVQLNPLEEAAAYQQLLEEFAVTHEELAGRIGRSRPVITNTIRLLKLPLPVQRRVAAGVLSAGHARALLGLDDASAQEDLATRIVAEGLSVRATEEAVTLAKSAPAARQKAAPRKAMHAPGLQDLADKLSDRFDTRVKVELGRRKGRIVVEFGSVDDLERITELMQLNQAKRTQNSD